MAIGSSSNSTAVGLLIEKVIVVYACLQPGNDEACLHVRCLNALVSIMTPSRQQFNLMVACPSCLIPTSLSTVQLAPAKSTPLVLRPVLSPSPHVGQQQSLQHCWISTPRYNILQYIVWGPYSFCMDPKVSMQYCKAAEVLQPLQQLPIPRKYLHKWRCSRNTCKQNRHDHLKRLHRQKRSQPATHDLPKPMKLILNE